MRTIITSILVLVCQLVSAQELKELRHSSTSNYKMDFYITFSEKKVKYEDTLHYFWFKAQKVHVTQGSSEGNLLHGPYSKFYYSGQLAEQGAFEKGLKVGQWKSWYESGNLKTIYNYKDGLLAGQYVLYNESGDIRESGKIRKGDKKVDEEKEGWFKRRKKIKEAMHPTELTKEEKKEQRKIKKEEKLNKRLRKKDERKIKREQEGNFIERLFNVRFKKKEKSPKKEKKKKEEKPKKEKKQKGKK